MARPKYLDLSADDIDADTKLPDLPPQPERPADPVPPPPPTTLTRAQRDALAGMVGERWTVAADAEVTGYDVTVDEDGVERGVLTLTLDGVHDATLSQMVTPPRHEEDDEVVRLAWEETLAAHEEALAAYAAELDDWNHLAHLHNVRDLARDTIRATKEREEREAEEAARFTTAVDERVHAVLAELGVKPT